MESDHRLEGGDYLDLIEQPVTGWNLKQGIGDEAVILSATIRANPPEIDHDEDDRPRKPIKDQPAWMREATVTLAMSNEMARALLAALERHLARKWT